MTRELSLILPDIRSALNVGAIFRSADAFGISHIYLAGYTPGPEHPKLAKTALGAESYVPWSRAADLPTLIKDLRDEHYQLLALEKNDHSQDIATIDLSDRVALIVGNEVLGVPDFICQLCDQTVHIPMCGHKESLNVATATGIALYLLGK